MKKLVLLAMTLLTLTSSVFAQRGGSRARDEGSITLRDGRTVLRIDVGDDRDDREILQRVRRLEQAVRDLQEKVYDLQSQPQPRGSYITVCVANIFGVNSAIIGKASTEIEARANGMAECGRKSGGIFCKEKEFKCEKTFE
jgi:peptidoglycan hydrolase CwlO-like protein